MQLILVSLFAFNDFVSSNLVNNDYPGGLDMIRSFEINKMQSQPVAPYLSGHPIACVCCTQRVENLWQGSGIIFVVRGNFYLHWHWCNRVVLWQDLLQVCCFAWWSCCLTSLDFLVQHHSFGLYLLRTPRSLLVFALLWSCQTIPAYISLCC